MFICFDTLHGAGKISQGVMRIMKNHREKQKGNVLVMVAVCLTLFFCFLALSVDIGWIMLTKSELQAAADSAALAGAAQLTDEDVSLLDKRRICPLHHSPAIGEYSRL